VPDKGLYAHPHPDLLTLVLVRHGRTRYNTEHRIQGWSDSELTADGLAGVQATAAHLAGSTLSAAYSSPSPRTLTTSEQILRHHPHLEVAEHDGLREFHFGEYEARPESEFVADVNWVELFSGVLDGTHPGLPGGESARTYLDRVGAAFCEIEDRHGPGENVLVVTHGMTLMVYLSMAGVYPEAVLANASVTVVRVGADGQRDVALVGHDPSGQAATPRPISAR
jgi:2,3-bisphosphoglycerate-dependent phosphoglycerate mutase